MDVQADLSLRWAHSHIAGFVMSRLMFLNDVIFMMLYMLKFRTRYEKYHIFLFLDNVNKGNGVVSKN